MRLSSGGGNLNFTGRLIEVVTKVPGGCLISAMFIMACAAMLGAGVYKVCSGIVKKVL